jgi:hypothetical protein
MAFPTEQLAVQTPSPPDKPVRRGLGQRVVRSLAVLGILLVLAYATIPLWLPVEALRTYFAGEMSRQMGVPVTIDRIVCTWEGGVEIYGLNISSPESFGPEPVVRVEHIQADFSPLTYFLVHKDIEWMEISQPKLAVRFDSQGNSNLAVLSRLPRDVTSQRISVHQAALTLQLPQDKRILTLSVADLQIIGGRLLPPARLTLSAALQQPNSIAPVSLHVQTEASGQTAADAAFSFANVELDQFPLVPLLNPLLESQRGPGGKHLKSVRGACSGMMSLKINTQGVVEHLDLGLKLLRLDIQLLEGPPLPVIDEVALDVRARLDLLTDHVDIDSVHVVFPGLDLAGKASLLANSSGVLESIGLIELSGRIEPSHLLPVLTGQATLDGKDLLSEGPMKVDLAVRRDGSALRLTADADATALALTRSGRTLKPSGRTLTWDFLGKLDWRDWNLVMEKDHLILGGNRSSGHGTILNVARRLEEFRQAPPGTAQTFARDLGCVEYQSVWELHDLDSIRQAAPSLGELLAGAKIQGDINGQVSIEQSQSGDTIVRASVTAPPKTRASLGEFRKPQGEAASMTFAGKIDRGGIGIRDADLDVTIGQALVDIDHLNVRWEDSPWWRLASAPSLVIDCDWSVEHAQGLLAAFPRWADKAKVQGMIREGTFHARVASDAMLAEIAADAGQLGVQVPTAFDKPIGQKAALKATLAIKGDAPQGVITLAAQTAFGEIKCQGAFPLSGPFDKGPLNASAALTLTDAKTLAQDCPLVAAQFLPGRLSGSGEATLALLRQDDGQFACTVSFHGGDLDFALPGDITKSAGVPLEGQCSVALAPQADGAGVRVRQVDLKLGDSHLSFEGGLDLQLQVPGMLLLPVTGTAVVTISPPQAIEGKLQARCVLNDPMFRICPPLWRLASRLGLQGRADLDATFQMIHPAAPAAPAQVRLSASVRADEFGLTRCGPLVKPAGLPCGMHLNAVAPMDLSEAAVQNFDFTVGTSGVTADGKIRHSKEGALEVPQAHLSLWTRDASGLAAIVPALKSYQLSGSLTSDLEIRDNVQSLPLVEFHARDLSGQLGGKKLLLDGGMRLEGLDHLGQPQGQVKSLSSDGLEIRIGENRFWVLADLKDLLAKPSGRFQLLAESVSDRDLNDYIVALAAAKTPWPATALGPPSATAPAPPPHLNSAERAEVQKRASLMIEELRKRMGDSPLKITLGVDRLKSYDANVRETYEARHLAMDISVDRRVVAIEYHAGVNGGMIESKSHVNFNDPAPKVENQTDITDVLAGPEILPLLANSFPGNIVHGKFNQRQRVSMPVRDSLAKMLDYRYVIRPVGSAVTVTTDGYVEGKGGPEFITRIFPGLNLTRYKYNTMTGFAEYKADGSADNDMVFDGASYNMYIEGRTDRDNHGEYMIGLILSPGTAESMHTWKQGRFPIMKFKGRIEDGKIYDQVISYPWPNETLYRIFLQNNIIYRAWLNRQGKN